MKTLVYHAGGLGDFLAMLPAVGSWRHAHPHDILILLGKPVYGEVGIHSGFFDEVWDVERASWAWFFAPGSAYPAAARELFSGISSVILFTAAHGAPIARIKALGVREVIVHAPVPLERIGIVRHYLSLTAGGDCPLEDCGPNVNAAPLYARSAQTIVKGTAGAVALHAGSGSAKKNWPIEHFRTLAGLLQKRGFPVIWLSGPAERGVVAPAGCLTAENAPLPTLIHVFKQCRAYIGNDSGISHLAAASGCPSIVLFGPSDPAVWKPIGAHVRIVTAPRGCAACHLTHKENKECLASCMERISMEEVLSAFDRLIVSCC